MKVSVITPTYNRKELLSHCIKKLLEQTHPPDEIIVIDDASTDGTHKLFASTSIPGLKYIKLDKKSGHWYARNVGIKEATGELIIFVDSDVLVAKNFISDHIYFHKNNDKIIVQGVVRHIRKPADFGIKTIRIDGICFTGIVVQNCSIRKKWLIEAGLFLESPYMGYMDVEIGMRLKSLGIKKIYTFRKCIAYHIDGYFTENRIKNLFNKYKQRGISSIYFINNAKYKNTEKLANMKTILIYNIFQTNKWVDKYAINLIKKGMDSPIFFISPVVKEIGKHHYKAKGIIEAYEQKNN